MRRSPRVYASVSARVCVGLRACVTHVKSLPIFQVTTMHHMEVLKMDFRIFKSSLLPLVLLWFICDTVAGFVVTAPPDPVVAVFGGDVVLDCQLVPAKPPQEMEIRWIYMPLTYSAPVHLYKDGQEDLTLQPLGYRGRTELFLDNVAQGNLSLKLKSVQVSDRGQYKCFVASAAKHDEIIVTLNVSGTGRSPWIEMDSYTSNGVRLGCRSDHWFPEPPILWVNGKGEKVAAQPEIRYQSDLQGLISVHSIIEIPKDSGNEYTCVINNNLLKETKEARIQIADAFFPRASGWMVAFWILFFLMLGAVCFALVLFRKLHNNIQGKNFRLQH
ncbi:hypothetical protein scyTo_0021883 [Scyliorhinus torazame]|uniref:Ig-like domain-containing protein n=1 Tax=Scyliorhinus torazame TaxID=75743 RepID=A0A401Q8S3_SCYTO|nr:hypothetical protein [Scyliorhinus torazame]